MKCEKCKMTISYDKKKMEINCPFCGNCSTTNRGMFIVISSLIVGLAVFAIVLSFFAPEKPIDSDYELPTAVIGLAAITILIGVFYQFVRAFSKK